MDISGVGSLPGQQPLIPNPVIADGGTAAARFQVDLVAMPTAGNHPSPTAVLSAYWDRILAGFREMTGHLRRPGIDPYRLLRRFEGARARRILRPTQAYVDIGRTLWHPASLHDEAAAVERARDILRRNADVLPGAPTDRAAIDGEIADLLAGARWTTRLNPEGIGGFAHGATGIGWALTRLALSDAGSAVERREWNHLAERAFAYQESLYRREHGNWLDVRIGAEEDFFTSWCHGSAGIGIGMLDLHRRAGDPAHLDMARRAARACAAEGFGWSHTLSHGDLGLWEFLTSLNHGDPVELDAEILTGLEQRGPVGGLAREAFSPSLMSGLAGVLHTLLRMHPEATLPNPLVLD